MYVLGFAFIPDRSKVLLIEKKRPAWQLGMLNGVGGKVEQGELISAAMAREFQEETGILTEKEHWASFGKCEGHDYKVYLYTTIIPEVEPQALTDEPPMWFPISDLGHLITEALGVPDAANLIALALQYHTVPFAMTLSTVPEHTGHYLL